MRPTLTSLKNIASSLMIIAAFTPLSSRGDIFYRCDHGTAYIINKISEGNGPDEKKPIPIKGYINIRSGINWTHYNKNGYASEETGKRFYCGEARFEFWPHLNTGNVEGQCGAWQGESIKITSWRSMSNKLPMKTPELYMDHCVTSFYIKRLIFDPKDGYIYLSRGYRKSSSQVYGPSFSCAHVHSLASLLICSSPELSKIDYYLNRNYKRLIHNVDKKEKPYIAAHQIAWITRKRKCKSYSCLCKLYKQDANYLNAMLTKNGQGSKNYGSLFGGKLSEYRYGGCS